MENPIPSNSDFVFDSTVSSEKYLEMLQTDVVPNLTATFPDNNHPCQTENTICFHQREADQTCSSV